MQSTGNKSRVILLIIGCCILYSIVFGFQAYIISTYFGQQQYSFRQVLLGYLFLAALWTIFTPLVYTLARDFPFEKEKLPVTIPVHLGTAALITLTVLGVASFFWQRIVVGSFNWDRLWGLVVNDWHSNVLLYFVLIGLYHVYDYYWRFREHQERAFQLEIASAQLETRLVQAQLNALKMQVHPHFLFNTLNSISVLMRDDTNAANQMLVRLSELLRVALRSEATQVIPLRQELEFLRDYLEIERTRFQDRLTVEFQVEDEALEVLVPNLVLQPLAENAIRHGIAPRPEAGVIQIRARRENGYVELSVSDNGSGLSSTSTVSNGIGLTNTKERLEKLYGDDQKFEIVSGENGGLQVKIRIPLNKNEQQNSSFDRR